MATQRTAPALWPNGKRIAVAIMVLYETWGENKAPSYSTQATKLKPGAVDHGSKAWSMYGGRAGVWRILRSLERHKVPATFFVSADCADLYPESLDAILEGGHEIAAHAFTQDQLLSEMSLEEQQKVIEGSVEKLERKTGRRPTGWGSPALAFTPETAGLLARAGLKWHVDVTYTDRPHIVQTAHGPIVGVPTSDFSDNRVLHGNPQDFVDVYRNTFEFLYENEPGGLLAIALHAQFGGRPMMTAAFEQVLEAITKREGVWFPRMSEMANCAE